MLMPDVLEIIDDPEVGGHAFQVRRTTTSRTLGRVVNTSVIYDVTGNIQPQDMSAQTSTSEDLMTESIVAYAKFSFSAGFNSGEAFTGPDEILYNGKVYRTTHVSDWSDWGFSIAYATRVHDMAEEVDTQSETQPSEAAVEEVE